MQDSSHTHIYYAINQIGTSQSLPLKSLTSSLGSTLWGSIFEPTRSYRADSDTICNDPRKSASHICTIPQKDQSQLRLIVVVNKAQIYLVNTRCGTHHTPTHITQSIKLGHHMISDTYNSKTRYIDMDLPILNLTIRIIVLLQCFFFFFKRGQGGIFTPPLPLQPS